MYKNIPIILNDGLVMGHCSEIDTCELPAWDDLPKEVQDKILNGNLYSNEKDR